MSAFIDITNQTFTRWIVRSVARRGYRGTLWNCDCTCGGVGIVEGVKLRTGQSKSCGCLRRELQSVKQLTHGHRKNRSPEYSSWQAAKKRCYDPNHEYFKDYGGRGIVMCEEWRESFETFLRDMGPRPKGFTLDRYPNKNGNYEPGNCRWATRKEQSNNQRSNHLATYNGETHTISEWSEKLGISAWVLYHRISDFHWPAEKAFLTPVRKSPKNKQ